MMSISDENGVGGIAGRKRMEKAKRGHTDTANNLKNYNAETADNVSAMTLATADPSAKEMRAILEQLLKEHGSSRSEELAARTATVKQQDAAHYK